MKDEASHAGDQASDISRDGSDHELLADLADDFARRYRRDEHPSVEEYAQKHPALAHQIRDLFPAMLVMERSVLDLGVDNPAAVEMAGTLVGRYKLLERIGEGGFGVVFMAEQQLPVRRKVAVKVIKPGMDTSQVIARFEAERQALAMMDHPNIAKVFDAGATDSGRPYFVMELVPGVPLIDYCEHNKLPPRERLALFVQVCEAIQHAHTKGIIHRDLKPTNVLVMLRDDRAVPKVIDFGVAKATGQQLTERTLFTNFAQMVGTPLYMSPEQAQMGGIDVDTRSDVYSLGVMLYELLTGTTPFDGQRLGKAALDEVRRIIREEEPPRPSTRLSTAAHVPALAPGRGLELRRLSGMVRGELDWIVMKAMEKDRARRYETASGLAKDVQRYLRDEEVQACPPSARYRLRKFVRQHRVPVLVTATVLLALLGGVVGTTLGMVRARKAEADEQQARGRAEHERDAAVEARKETFEALIDLTDFTDQNLLVDQRVSSPAERELLERMAARYERMAAAPQGAGSPQDMQARSLAHAGQAYLQLGDSTRSLDAWRRAADLYRDRSPANTATTPAERTELRAHARRCRSVALAAEKLRRWSEAIEFSRRQLEFAAAGAPPGERPDQDLSNLLVTGNWCLTISLTADGRLDELQAPWQELVRLVVWSDSGGVNDGACTHLVHVAATLAAAGKPADPAAVLAPGLAERRAKLAANPAAADVRLDLRRGYRILALLHERSGKFREALEANDQVIAVADAPPAGDESQVASERFLVFGAVIGRAVCLDALGREADAEEAWKAVYKSSGRDAAGWVITRMTHLATKGQPERAVRLAEGMLARPGSEHRYNAACVYAIASAASGLSPDRKEAYCCRAVALLDEARSAGYFNDPAVVAQVKSDADLNPVRGRDDFRKLLAKLETGNPK